MSQYNKLSDIQYARFQILHVDLHFGLFWLAGIPTMYWGQFYLQGGLIYTTARYVNEIAPLVMNILRRLTIL